MHPPCAGPAAPDEPLPVALELTLRVLCVQHQPDCPPGLVGDRLTELGARLDVVDPRRRLPDPSGYDLLVPLGSADSAADASVPYLSSEAELLAEAVRVGVPVFGICFGAQLLCRVLGGTVAPLPDGPEIGWLRLDMAEDGPIEPGPWLAWHLDGLTPPPGSAFARSLVATQAYRVGPHLGVQFHPEATVASIERWAERHQASFDRLGEDPTALIETARADREGRRRRAANLVDLVVERAVRHGALGRS